MPGNLFTNYFLTEGIKATAEWRASISDSTAFAVFGNGVRQRYDALSGSEGPNEAVTEQELIRPVLELLGWADYLPQQGTTRNEDIPDYLLFTDAASKERAAGRANPEDRFRDAIVVEESKRFGLSLDARDRDTGRQSRTPHGQILRYLSMADIESESRIRWGFLTNGGLWRLYDYRARPRATGYFEAHLGEMLESGGEDGLRLFYLLLRRDSFTPQQGATTSFLEAALAQGRRYEEKVAQDLSSVVFERVFPKLVQALADATGEDLSRVRHAALILLYRLLFVLYAEDRGLLPVNDPRYEDYGLRKPVRDHVAHRMQGSAVFSASASSYYDHLMTLFRQIDEGDESIGLPPYNGGLFASEAAPLLKTARLTDKIVGDIIYDLSHTETEGARHFVNYRDMSVQQLGSIYERLLEREPVRDDNGGIVVRPNSYARKDSGSFFTPQELVDLIVDRTLKPLAEERLKAFEDKSEELRSDHRAIAERHAELLALDPAEAVLDLKVLDPAMGSGHFLVTAVDFLSDYIAEVAEYAPAVPEWLYGDYSSPLVERVAAIRRDILQRAQASDWVMDEAQLTDQSIIRRMVLKRCIYGVEKNPLTVELAKVSLWLHSFTVGAPLSFLDHHLRCGDSLVGLRVPEATAELNRLGGLFASSAIAGAEAATSGMQRIEEMSDADVAEVRESAELFRGVEDTTADLRGLLDFLCGLRWLTSDMRGKAHAALETPLVETLGSRPNDAYSLLARGPDAVGDEETGGDDTSWSGFKELWSDARCITDREGFLHWEAAFPGVWQRWQEEQPVGGFDAVIGNPPWDRIKLQEVEWFATRSPELALAPTAAARKTGIQQLRDKGAPLAGAFDAAKERADKLGELIRASGNYPLLGGGDINLYSLFVERAMGLIKLDGFVGLLTPSGIYADKTAAAFFKSISTSGRVGGLFDFENRRLGTGLPPFFPDVDSRFKFCALIFGGTERRFDETACAFFLHDTRTIENPERCFPLAPSDFARVNPNTGTAPIFRTRRDAEITRRIYERHPVLVDRSQGEERRVWPVSYHTMFHMANDSHLFRTAAHLESEGFYPVEGNRWQKGKELYLPLYEGKMVQAFDHRAASITNREGNLFRPGQPDRTLDDEHRDPAFSPRSRYWVSRKESTFTETHGWSLAFKDITASTNVRTMIAAVVPQVGCGHTLPVLIPAGAEFDAESTAQVLANLNSFGFDYVTRQKVQATHLTWYIVEQLPVIAAEGYDRRFGDKTARELVRDHALRLTYTANDMAPFARDLGFDGPPFIWDEEERRHLRARLDALYFHLYGLSREDAGYVLDTFPIVRRQDDAQFGSYRTRDLIFAYMNALAAGDAETVVSV